MNSIEIKNLTKNYKDITAVDNLNLDIKEGELFSLLGVNGAGKTTTIKMLTCLTKPNNGDALIFSKSINTNSDQVKSFLNLSPQETAIAPNLSVYENLDFIAGIYNIEKDKRKEKITEMISKFKLEKFKNKKAGKLSGGWQRKLSIAMALLTEPKLLFLDEPTLGLDVIARRELWNIIEELKGNITIILTTHYMEEAEKLSDRVGIMKDGKLLDVDTPNNFIKKTKEKTFEDAFVKIVSEVK